MSVSGFSRTGGDGGCVQVVIIVFHRSACHMGVAASCSQRPANFNSFSTATLGCNSTQ